MNHPLRFFLVDHFVRNTFFPPHPPQMMESQGAIFFRKDFTTKYTGGEKNNNIIFKNVNPEDY